MNEIVGADVEQVEALARRFEASSKNLSELLQVSSLSIMVTEWTGADIDKLRAEWNRQAKPSIARSAGALGQLASQLKVQAAQQREASAAASARSGTSLAGGVLFQDVLQSPTKLSKLSSDEVAAFWAGLSDEEKSQLIAKDPLLLGNLSGIPFADRIAINEINARNRYNSPDASPEEKAYLKSVFDPGTGRKTQLVTYDPVNDRIVEMIGTPSEETKHVITYVPGTGATMDGFYNQSTQQIANRFVDGHPDTVAFVAKDGSFPKLENVLTDSNSESFVKGPAQSLANFTADVSRESNLSGAETTAIGHSWGLAAITGSEVDGAKYDQVISLSGAGMPKDWVPNPSTEYSDYSYADALQFAQASGAVWDGHNPRTDSSFHHGDYYVGPHDSEVFIKGPFGTMVNPLELGVLVDNHALIATTDSANRLALDDIEHDIYG